MIYFLLINFLLSCSASQQQFEIDYDFKKVFPSPYVRYRAWFPNDRDFIIPWQRLSEENYEAFFETMLRLKLNTLEGGIADAQSFKPPFPARREATVARERGLMVTGHHVMVFDSSYNNWNSYWNNVKQQSAPEIRLTKCQGWSQTTIFTSLMKIH